MKRFACILMFLFLLTFAHADMPADSFPDFSGSMPELPDFPEFSTDNWPSDFTVPDSWGDLSIDGFDVFPGDWDSLPGTMEEWEERFRSFREQAGGQSGEIAFPDWDTSDTDALKKAFGKGDSGREEEGITDDIRNLFSAAFSDTGGGTSSEITTGTPPLEPGLKYSDTTGWQQLSAIAGAIGFPEFSSGLQPGSLPEDGSIEANQDTATAKKLFAESAEQLAVSMNSHISSDRCCSLYGEGKVAPYLNAIPLQLYDRRSYPVIHSGLRPVADAAIRPFRG